MCLLKYKFESFIYTFICEVWEERGAKEWARNVDFTSVVYICCIYLEENILSVSTLFLDIEMTDVFVSVLKSAIDFLFSGP